MADRCPKLEIRRKTGRELNCATKLQEAGWDDTKSCHLSTGFEHQRLTQGDIARHSRAECALFSNMR